MTISDFPQSLPFVPRGKFVFTLPRVGLINAAPYFKLRHGIGPYIRSRVNEISRSCSRTSIIDTGGRGRSRASGGRNLGEHRPSYGKSGLSPSPSNVSSAQKWDLVWTGGNPTLENWNSIFFLVNRVPVIIIPLQSPQNLSHPYKIEGRKRVSKAIYPGT